MRRLAERVATEVLARGTIDDLLELSRLEAGALSDAEDVVVADVVAEAVAGAAAPSRPSRSSTPWSATSRSSPATAAIVSVANLLDNAVKYSEPAARDRAAGTDGPGSTSRSATAASASRP